jgi:long-chain acyl-CoA synthetase
MMGKRQEVLAARVPAYAERRRQIEAEPLPANIGALIDAAADEAGDTLLWDFFESGETITYSEMRRTVNGLATQLLSLGIDKGTHIGVMLPNIAALPLTWLAIGRIGAVMAPINVSYRERELAHVVDNADVTWLVAHKDCLPMIDAAREQGQISIPPSQVIVVGGADGRDDRLGSTSPPSRATRLKPRRPSAMTTCSISSSRPAPAAFPRAAC